MIGHWMNHRLIGKEVNPWLEQKKPHSALYSITVCLNCLLSQITV